MLTIGYRFYVTGEFCKHLRGLPDPADEDWEVFEMPDLHPSGKDVFTVWVPNFREHCDEALKEAIERAIVVVDWMRGERGWDGFYAGLWAPRKEGGERLFSWELC